MNKFLKGFFHYFTSFFAKLRMWVKLDTKQKTKRGAGSVLSKTISHTGTRTRVFRVLCIRKEVKAGYPNQLDYMGSDTIRETIHAVSFLRLFEDGTGMFVLRTRHKHDTNIIVDHGCLAIEAHRALLISKIGTVSRRTRKCR